MWTDLDVDDLAQPYDSEITAILDRLVPVRTVLVTYRRTVLRRTTHLIRGSTRRIGQWNVKLDD